MIGKVGGGGGDEAWLGKRGQGGREKSRVDMKSASCFWNQTRGHCVIAQAEEHEINRGVRREGEGGGFRFFVWGKGRRRGGRGDRTAQGEGPTAG